MRCIASEPRIVGLNRQLNLATKLVTNPAWNSEAAGAFATGVRTMSSNELRAKIENLKARLDELRGHL
jgi:hypothetical protein